MNFCPVLNYVGEADLSKVYWNLKKKVGVKKSDGSSFRDNWTRKTLESYKNRTMYGNVSQIKD